jgi:hypothetical protein
MVEMVTATAVATAVLFTGLSVSSMALRAADKNGTENGLSGDSRLAMDETLYQLRGCSQVLASHVLNGETHTTSASEVVLMSPGYNPASPKIFLGSVTDYIAIQYDATSKRLIETIIPGPGSVRPARNKQVIARNVKSCTFTYRVRDIFTSGSSGSTKFTLNATPLSTPVLYVNGVLTSYTYNSSNNSATVSLSGKSNDVQFVYDITPSSGTDALARVCEVNAIFQLSTTDGRQITRTATLHGAARLRNVRK